MAALTANEKWMIVQLVASGQFRTIDNHHDYEWWIIDLNEHAHVIFRTADRAEYEAKDREACALVEQYRSLISAGNLDRILGQILLLVAPLTQAQLRLIVNRLQELVEDRRE